MHLGLDVGFPFGFWALLNCSAFMPHFVLGGKLPTTLNFPSGRTVYNSEPTDPET